MEKLVTKVCSCVLLKVLWKEVAEHFDKLVQFVEQNNHYNRTEVINFHILRYSFYTKRGQAVRQADIRDLMRDMSNHVDKFMEDDSRPVIHTPGSPRQPDNTMSMLEGEEDE